MDFHKFLVRTRGGSSY